MIEKVTTTVLEAAASLPDVFRSMQSGSLVEYTAPTRIQPIVLLDPSLEQEPFTSDILQTLTSLFAGYYLQAVAITNNIGDINVIQRLDKLNPKRSPGDNLLNALDRSLSKEAYQHSLPNYRKLSVEAQDVDRKQTSTHFGRNMTSDLRSAENLAVGKVLEVSITNGTHTAVIPITVTLQPITIDTDVLISNMGLAGHQHSAKERYHLWRAGAIKLVQDIVLCNDLIEQKRKGLFKDKDGVFSEILKRRRGNLISGLMSGSFSVANASAMLVVSTDTQVEIERALSGSLHDAKTRQRLFEESALMLMAFVDRELGAIRIYHRGIANPTKLLLRDLKSINKNTGPDVSEILKAYRAASAPSF